MKQPYASSKFEPEMDSPINSKLLEVIFELMAVKYDFYDDSFKSLNFGWEVYIEDQHENNEPEPHYTFKVSDGKTSGLISKTYCVKYCDYHSTVDEDGKPIIKTDPGMWKIHISLNEWAADHNKFYEYASAINEAYKSVMKENLKDYFIATSPMIELKDLENYEKK
jgi:hypothetical protein